MKKRALVAINHPEKMTDVFLRLAKLGWFFIVTKNVAENFKKHNIPAQDVADFVGVSDPYGIPATLHPKIEEALTLVCKETIDLVFDMPYAVQEGHDVGGRTLLALGAKGNRWVFSEEIDFRSFVDMLEKNDARLEAFKRQQIGKVLWQIAEYYATFAGMHSQDREGFSGRLKTVCQEGENPYQKFCQLFILDSGDPLGFDRFVQASGEAPCFTTLADMDNILCVAEKLKECFFLQDKKFPFITIAAKHGNPCGIGIDWEDPCASIRRSLWGNPQAVWGGEVICNFVIDRALAQELLESAKRKEIYDASFWMLDLIVAAGFSQEAIVLLGKRRQRILMSHPKMAAIVDYKQSWHYRFVRGGYLKQQPADFVLNLKDVDWVGESAQAREALFISWAASYHSFLGGNEVALAQDRMLIGLGGGPSTLMATRHAIDCATACHHNVKGSVFCANAFFPFVDAPELLRGAGCVAGVVPAGGKQHEIILKYFKDHSVSCGFIPAPYRGFSRH